IRSHRSADRCRPPYGGCSRQELLQGYDPLRMEGVAWLEWLARKRERMSSLSRSESSDVDPIQRRRETLFALAISLLIGSNTNAVQLNHTMHGTCKCGRATDWH